MMKETRDAPAHAGRCAQRVALSMGLVSGLSVIACSDGPEATGFDGSAGDVSVLFDAGHADGGALDVGVRDAGADGSVMPPDLRAAQAYVELADALTATTSQELAKVAAMVSFEGGFAGLLGSIDTRTSTGARLDALVTYFDAMQLLAEKTLEGRLASATATLGASVIDASGRDYESGLAATWAAEGLVPLELRLLELTSYAVAHPGLSSADALTVAEDLAEVLPDPEMDPRGALLDGMRRLAALAREARRGMRWVKGEAIVFRTVPRLWDNISYSGAPDFVSLCGFGDMRLLTTWYFFPYDSAMGQYVEMDQVHEALIRTRIGGRFEGREPYFLVLDIEHWSLSDAEREVSLAKLRRVLEIVHDENPSLVIGYYGIMPRRDPNAAYTGRSAERYLAWQAHNATVAAALAPEVDILFPSLYTLHEGEDRWLTYGGEMIYQAQLVSRVRHVEMADDGPAPKKRVLPYLWPQYHPNGGNNPRGYEFIEGAFWETQLETAFDQADGAVIWGAGAAWDPSWEGSPEYNWWQATQTLGCP